MKYFKEINLFILLGLLIAGVFTHFSSFFNYEPSSTDLVGWMNTAIYFNNVFTPVFLLISVVLLYWTWKDTRNGFHKQSADNIYNYIMDSTSKFAENFVQKIEFAKDSDETSKKDLMYIISRFYLLHASEGLSVENKEKLSNVYDLYTENVGFVSIASTYFFSQYSNITDKQHKYMFKLHLYGILGLDVIFSILITKLGTKKELEKIGADTTDTVNEIEFLKSVAVIAHNDKDDKLLKELYTDKLLDDFYKILKAI